MLKDQLATLVRLELLAPLGLLAPLVLQVQPELPARLAPLVHPLPRQRLTRAGVGISTHTCKVSAVGNREAVAWPGTAP